VLCGQAQGSSKYGTAFSITLCRPALVPEEVSVNAKLIDVAFFLQFPRHPRGVRSANLLKVHTWNFPKAFHFTPTSASWLNAVESIFSVITRRRIRRGVFRSVGELEAAIRRYIQDHNRHVKPFVWTKAADQIFQKLSPLFAPSE